MDLSKLEYTEKWVEYGFLTEEVLNLQIKEFEMGEDKNPEHFRYASFLNWLSPKKSISDEEIDQFLELATIDSNELMAGSAVRTLFVSSIISEEQFEMLKGKLPAFGEWTEKLIVRETLERQLKASTVTLELFKTCLAYKIKFQDNRLLIQIIEATEDVELLAQFESKGIGKRIKTMASKKLAQVNRAAAKQ